MTDHRTGKWATAILAAQNADGTWGVMFHGLAQPTNTSLTTKQALRRLHALGFSKEDESIRRIVDTMATCLRGERKIDAYWEKGVDWAMYEPLMPPPACFASKETGCWLAALELLAEYPCAKEKLAFAAAHLYLNIGPDSQWDLGAKANDKVYFPLSDSWRTESVRKADCTERIRRFLDKIT